jgi:carboxymethylenebutenolidase
MKQLNPEYTASLQILGGERFLIDTADGPMDCYRFTSNASGLPVIFYCDAGGLRPGMFEMARKLADFGHEVLMPNLYHRLGDYPNIDPATVFSEPEEHTRLMAMAGSMNVAEAMCDTQACLDYLNSAQVGVLGYCMGGKLALSAAGHFDTITAAASIHSGSLATGAPDSPHHLAAKIQGRLYIGVAEIDPFFLPEEQARLKASLDQAGTNYQLEVYPNTQHGFAVVDMPVFDSVSAAQHWREVQTFFGLRSN